MCQAVEVEAGQVESSVQAYSHLHRLKRGVLWCRGAPAADGVLVAVAVVKGHPPANFQQKMHHSHSKAAQASVPVTTSQTSHTPTSLSLAPLHTP